MDEKEEKILYICTHAGEDPEKAAMPFVMANAAITMDIKTTIALQVNGVYLAQKGYADTMLPAGGFPPVKKRIQDFMEHGGKLLVCVPCIKERNIDEDSDMIDGAQTTTAGILTVEALESDAVFVY